MAQALNTLVEVIFDEEATFGSDPGTPAARLLYVNSEGLGLTKNLIPDESISGSRNQKKPTEGNSQVQGSITLPVNPFVGTILKHALGTSTPTGTDPYTHTMKVGSLPPGLVIEKHVQDKTPSPAFEHYFKYNGCRINNLAFSFSSEGNFLATIDILGQKETLNATTSFDTSGPEDKGNIAFTMADIDAADILEGGSAIATITTWDFTLTNNLDGDMFTVGGGGLRNSIPGGKVLVTGTLTAFFDSIALYNKALALTESSFKVTFKKGDGLGSAGNESLEIFIPELVYGTATPLAESDTGGMLVILPFSAYFDDSTEASDMQIILKNTDATI
jgi:hypothetical protein